MANDPSPYPQLIRLAWGVGSLPRSGPRPALTVHQIIDAAIELADEGGLTACSMPKLASRLGIGTMSLYRYVTDKDELTTLMLDAATGAVPTKAPRADRWEVVLQYYATQAVARYRSHPWMLDVPIAGFPQTPFLLEWLDLGLTALATTGLDDQQQLGSMLLLDGYVNATARLVRAGREATENPSLPPVDLMDDARFPTLTRLICHGALEDDDFADYGLNFGIERILAGIRLLAVS